MSQEYGKMLGRRWHMLVFSEYQTGTIDLSLSFYGYEECTPNYSFGPAIRDTYVLHYITKGQGKFHYNGKIVDLKEGDFFLLKPDELTFYQADSEEPWSYYWIGISGTKVRDFMRFSTLHAKGFLKKTEVETEKIGQFMERLVHKAEASKMTSHYQLHLLSQIYELLFLISEVAPDIYRSHPSPTYQLYLTCRHMIETHYNKDHLSIQEIADDLNVHRSYLTTVFKEFHQISPKEFLHSVRMQRAQQLLTNTDESIKIVAYSVGFSDPLYFSKAFKAYSQLTPSQYRNKHKI